MKTKFIFGFLFFIWTSNVLKAEVKYFYKNANSLSTEIYHSIIDNNNDIILIGKENNLAMPLKFYISKIDTNFNVIWTNSLPINNCKYAKIYLAQNGDYIVSTDINGISVFRFSSSGSLLATNHYTFDFNSTPLISDMTEFPNGELVFCGNNGETNGARTGFLLFCKPNLEIKNAKTLDVLPYPTAIISFGSIVNLGSYIYIGGYYNLNNLGMVITMDTIFYSTSFAFYKDTIYTSGDTLTGTCSNLTKLNNEIYISGSFNGTNNSATCFSKLDTANLTLNNKFFLFPNWQYASMLISKQGNDYFSSVQVSNNTPPYAKSDYSVIYNTSGIVYAKQLNGLNILSQRGFFVKHNKLYDLSTTTKPVVGSVGFMNVQDRNINTNCRMSNITINTMNKTLIGNANLYSFSFVDEPNPSTWQPRFFVSDTLTLGNLCFPLDIPETTNLEINSISINKINNSILVRSTSNPIELIEVYSLDGKKIFTKKNINEYNYEINTLNQGFYIVKAKSKNLFSTRKIILN